MKRFIFTLVIAIFTITASSALTPDFDVGDQIVNVYEDQAKIATVDLATAEVQMYSETHQVQATRIGVGIDEYFLAISFTNPKSDCKYVYCTDKMKVKQVATTKSYPPDISQSYLKTSSGGLAA